MYSTAVAKAITTATCARTSGVSRRSSATSSTQVPSPRARCHQMPAPRSSSRTRGTQVIVSTTGGSSRAATEVRVDRVRYAGRAVPASACGVTGTSMPQGRAAGPVGETTTAGGVVTRITTSDNGPTTREAHRAGAGPVGGAPEEVQRPCRSVTG